MRSPITKELAKTPSEETTKVHFNSKIHEATLKRTTE